MSDMIDSETNDEILDAIRVLDDRLRKVEREVAHLAQAMNDADLLDVDEDEFDR